MKELNTKKSGWAIAVLTFCFVTAYGQGDAAARQEIADHRAKEEKEFMERVFVTFSKKEKKAYHGLKYYPIDLKYRVPATFIRTEGMPMFKMKTTTDRLPDYQKYGEVTFTLDGQQFKLNVYQSPDVMKRPGYEDYLFIPFTDKTNGSETYEVGRYLEFRIPKSQDVILDFNQCYNPYCSYSAGFSCPIPPAENDLPIGIPVGEKKFHE